MTSHVYGVAPLAFTAHSKFIDVHTTSDFMNPDVFVKTLNEAAAAYAQSNPGATIVVIPGGDDYSNLLSQNKQRLDAPLVPIVADPDTIANVSNKETFYALCERAGVPFPATQVVGNVSRADLAKLSITYPVVVKPTDGKTFRNHPFEGQKKAFILNSFDQLAEVFELAYAAGYPDKLVVQDCVPGDDSFMRVVNGYVTKSGKLSLVSMGQPLLEDYSPMAIGNYAAILSHGDNKVYAQVEKLISATHYEGFFNLDLKYDSRDGSYKFLDFNPRLGRSSYYVTLSGNNIAKFVVADVVKGQPLPLSVGTQEYVWLGVPKGVMKKYASDNAAKKTALKLLRAGKYGSTVWGERDRDLHRLTSMTSYWLRFFPQYMKHYGHREFEG
jgi:D-aspartate ligase